MWHAHAGALDPRKLPADPDVKAYNVVGSFNTYNIYNLFNVVKWAPPGLPRSPKSGPPSAGQGEAAALLVHASDVEGCLK